MNSAYLLEDSCVGEIGVRGQPADMFHDDAHHAEHAKPLERVKIGVSGALRRAHQATPTSGQRPRERPSQAYNSQHN